MVVVETLTFFSQFLKMADQLQTSVISKRLELEQRDCAHIKDLSYERNPVALALTVWKRDSFEVDQPF